MKGGSVVDFGLEDDFLCLTLDHVLEGHFDEFLGYTRGRKG